MAPATPSLLVQLGDLTVGSTLLERSEDQKPSWCVLKPPLCGMVDVVFGGVGRLQGSKVGMASCWQHGRVVRFVDLGSPATSEVVVDFFGL